MSAALALLGLGPVAAFAVLPVPLSAFMLGYEFAGFTDDRPPLAHEWVPWSAIATPMKLAVIAAEDQNFPHHHGFDIEAIRRAMVHNRQSERLRGASTISQQAAKNLFLWPGRSWLRKGLEAGYTALIEALWSKRRILTVYLNIAEFGRGVYGVEAAAQRYFHKPAARLNRHEAALLAAVLPNPVRLRADRPSAYVAARAAWIERQMRQLGDATVEDL